jgi:hypothetical protein
VVDVKCIEQFCFVNQEMNYPPLNAGRRSSGGGLSPHFKDIMRGSWVASGNKFPSALWLQTHQIGTRNLLTAPNLLFCTKASLKKST